MAGKADKFKVITISSDPANINPICEQILEKLHQKSYSQEDIFGIHLALEESLVNAVKHGNNSDPSQKVVVEFAVSDKKMEVIITDQGHGFNPCNVPDPRCKDNIYKPGGRGLLLIREFMDFVEYNDAGNSIHLVRLKNSEK